MSLACFVLTNISLHFCILLPGGLRGRSFACSGRIWGGTRLEILRAVGRNGMSTREANDFPLFGSPGITEARGPWIRQLIIVIIRLWGAHGFGVDNVIPRSLLYSVERIIACLVLRFWDQPTVTCWYGGLIPACYGHYEYQDVEQLL